MYTSFLEHSSEYDRIDRWLKMYRFSNYKINSDLTVDVEDVYFSSSDREFDIPFKFGRIEKDFIFSCDCRRLGISSDFLPTYVGRNFTFHTNRGLKEIKNGPQYVGGSYDIDDNSLETLEGCPRKINGNFSARSNQLKTFYGGPEIVLGDCILASNQLTDLKYSPRKIGGKFNINFNRVDSLKYLTFDIKLTKSFIVDIFKNPLKDNGEIEKYLQKYLEIHPEEIDSLIDMDLSDEFYYKNAKIFGTDDEDDFEYESEDELED